MNARLASAALASAVLSSAACAGGGAAAPEPAAAAAPAPAPRRDFAEEAYAARRARDFARAEALATEGIETRGGRARLYFERGVARMELGKKEDALADFGRLNAIQEDPAALLLAGNIELQLSRWESAEKDLGRAVALAPSNARAWASLAQARIALRDVPGATAAHQKAAALAPGDAYVKEVGERLSRAAPAATGGAEAVPSSGTAPAKP
jgi:tetratricopeptide (TPR) repeat protein